MIPDYLKNRPMSLALAIQSGQTSKVKLLIDNGADVNAPLDLTSLNQNPFFSMMNMGMMGQRNANLTPLALATRSNRTEIVKLLIDNGADVNAPLDLTSLNQNPFFSMMNMGMMGQRNANLTPLALATRSNRTEIVKLLIENGAKVNDALALAIQSGQTSKVKLLIDNGADVNAPLDLTSLNQNPFFSMMNMGMMGQRNANLTPLALATRSNRTEIVKLLMENGAKVNVHNDRGLNPLREACKRGYVDIAKLLIDVILSKNLNEKKPDFVKQANQELSDYWDKPIKINYLLENRIIGSKNSTEKILASHLPLKKDSLFALSFSQLFKSLNAEAIQDKVANGTNQSVLNTTLPHKLS